MRRILISLLALLPLGLCISLEDCPDGVAKDEYLQVFQDSCFRFELTQKKDYDDAEKVCERDGGTLALVRTPEVALFLANQSMTTYDFTGLFFFGLKETVDEGTYEWADGKIAGGLRPDFTWQNWAPGARQSLKKYLKDCTVLDMSKSGKWLDAYCEEGWFTGSKQHFICQYKVKVQPTPAPTRPHTTPCPTFVCDLDCGFDGYLLDAKRCLICQCNI